MAVPSFPFPPRNPKLPNVHDIIFVRIEFMDIDTQARETVYRNAYDRASSTEAKVFESQYESIADELADSFAYVSPANDNGSTYSVKFAEIIKNAANVFELISRKLYEQFYNEKDEINIFNYLALDRHV